MTISDLNTGSGPRLAAEDLAVRRLACAVISQAVADLASPHRAVRDDARHFLSGGEMLRVVWGPLAGVEWRAVADVIKRAA